MVVVFLVLPLVLKSRCIAEAAERGSRFTIDHVDIGLGEVPPGEIVFSLDGVPQLAARATDAQVALSGLTPADATVHGLRWRSTVPWRRAKVIRGVASRRSGARGTFERREGQLRASAPRLDRLRTDRGSTRRTPRAEAIATGALRLTAEHLSLTAGDATFGPWRTTLERDAQQTRIDIELDPVVQAGRPPSISGPPRAPSP